MGVVRTRDDAAPGEEVEVSEKGGEEDDEARGEVGDTEAINSVAVGRGGGKVGGVLHEARIGVKEVGGDGYGTLG